ncbi:MAG: M28 family metallopeptidase [Candidatus Helarchaeota archaeon]
MNFSDDDAQIAYEHTRILSYPRLVGSDGEKEAREYIFNEFKEMGVEVSREEFRCSDFPINFMFRIISPVVGTLLLIMSIFYLSSIDIFTELFRIIHFSPLAFVFSISTFVLALFTSKIQNMSFGSFKNTGNVFTTENIIGKISSENSKANLIYMGHYDTKSQLYPAIIRVFLFLLGIIWALISSFETMLCQILVLFGQAQYISTNPFLFNFLHFDNIWAAIVPFIINFLLIFNYVGNKSPGALDNASAVGILLALAKKFRKKPLKNVDLYFVATGAEELGLYGAAAYIQKHKSEFNPKNTYFLNYDSPSMKGGQKILTGYGLVSTSKILNKHLIEIGRKQGFKVGSIYLPFGAATDHVPIQKNGYEVAIIVSFVRRVHTKKDKINYITVEGLKKASILGFELAKKIDNMYN